MESSYKPFSSQFSLIVLIIAFFAICHVSASAAPAPAPASFKKIYAFGDSFTDTGNTRSESGPNGFMHVSNLPYGMTFFRHPTNRYSDGRLVIDFVAETLSLPYLPPYLNSKADTSHGVNFAIAGSTAINHKFYVRHNITLNLTPQSLQTQLTWFRNFLASRGCQAGKGMPVMPQCKAVMDDALFWVGEIGVNDYAYSFGSSVSPITIQNLGIKSVSGFVQALLDMGAKYIVVQGVPPTGCLPLTLTLAALDDRDGMGCVGTANKQMGIHNSLLQGKLDGLQRQYPHAVISFADYLQAYNTILKNKEKYGFKEPFKACCGTGGGNYNFDILSSCGSREVSKACVNPSQFVNWDGIHLTEAMYKVLADLFIRQGFCRPSFAVLLSSKRRGG
ncbi:hypothetical protein GIB67_018836 [Kingdonia uniflora]|uniref:GDSL esterase/lipase n=1 Tax=Kingdonia uniflora TaxID=39325 RepID=A0A7J7NEJ3_9MAGN|nr:hypothetical protein GIB67_018836 [Kingdonia uniflora]